jgi:hypothetical protein
MIQGGIVTATGFASPGSSERDWRAFNIISGVQDRDGVVIDILVQERCHGQGATAEELPGNRSFIRR